MRGHVIGMHLGLPTSHVAITTDYGITVHRCTPSAGYGPSTPELIRRHHWMARDIGLTVAQFNPVLVVVNQPGEQDGSNRWDSHGLWWHVVKDLVGDLRPISVIDDDTAFTYATGVNRATDPLPFEDTVLARLTDRYGQERRLTSGQAAALIRAAMGADHLGHPVAPVPARHRAALDSVERWAEVWR
ncbi:hypothetical protein ACIA8R_29600 [Nonomuraea sp. NPDC051191]|uniref:hypothetical protein n=1 Tax=Nonomuraea sp. NPDC051191 TaxID=3364372 RepID=UPI00378EF7BE